MLIGNKNSFGIEYEIRDRFGSFIYCNFRFWLGGIPVGDWDEECVLGVLIHSAVGFIEYRGNRHFIGGDLLEPQILWNRIKEFTDTGNDEMLWIGIEGQYRMRFLLHLIADDSLETVADVVVVDRADRMQRLLWCRLDDNIVNELILEKETVDDVVAKFIECAAKV